MKLEINNELQSLLVASALMDAREKEEGYDCETGVEEVEKLLRQFEGSNVWHALGIEEVVEND